MTIGEIIWTWFDRGWPKYYPLCVSPHVSCKLSIWYNHILKIYWTIPRRREVFTNELWLSLSSPFNLSTFPLPENTQRDTATRLLLRAITHKLSKKEGKSWKKEVKTAISMFDQNMFIWVKEMASSKATKMPTKLHHTWAKCKTL